MAMRLRVIRNFTDGETKEERKADDEYLFEEPAIRRNSPEVGISSDSAHRETQTAKRQNTNAQHQRKQKQAN